MGDTPLDLSCAIFFPRFSAKPSWYSAADREISYAAIRERRSAINLFLVRVPGPVVNRPHVGLENGSKSLQMIELSQAGFRVPPWIVTNSRQKALFFDSSVEGGCLFKSVSGSREGLARLNAAGEAKFTGEVRFNEQWLEQPLRWRKPRMIFVCAHGNLFHESVPDEWIDRVFAVMALAPQHTFQVLTKRGDRMREYLERISRDGGWLNIAAAAGKMCGDHAYAHTYARE